MANFEFQSFWPKKMDFFIMERPFYPVTPSNFDIFHHSWINQNGQKMGYLANLKHRVDITLQARTQGVVPRPYGWAQTQNMWHSQLTP